MAYERLGDCVFSDLYLTIGSEVLPIVKGLRVEGEEYRWKRGGLQPLPIELLEDARRLGDAIRLHHETSGGMREFTLGFHGVTYRCSLIAAPEGKFSVIKPEEPSLAAQSWCIRHLASQVPSLQQIRMPESIIRDLTQSRRERGLILVSGSFSSGKTTTSSSLFDTWVAMEAEVGVTLEDPPEIPLARVCSDRGAIYQIDLTDKPIHVAIKHARRWSPRYVFLGEIRTAETAIELLQMAISGPLVICTIHAADPVQAVIALCRFASRSMEEQTAREMVASSLKMILHQEMCAGAVKMQLVRLSGRENFGMRNKVESGQFQKLYEEVSRQEINRQKVG